MKKSKRLELCNWSLLILTVLIVTSGIQLEIISGGSISWVSVHIILGISFSLLIAWHLELHFQRRNWLRLLWKQKFQNTKWLTVTGILTLLTAVIATIGWLASPVHSKIGAVHGKLGFLFVILIVWHIFRRIRYYRLK